MRKQRKASLSVLLVMILGVTGTTFFVAQGKWSVAEAYLGAITFCLYGLPLIGAIVGASAAMGIRNQSVRDSEEMLPSNPAEKVFGAYVAGAIYFLGIVLMVFAMYPSWTMELTWFALALLYLHFLAFSITYALKLPVLGAGLAVILVGLDTFFMASFSRIAVLSPLSTVPFWLASTIPVWVAGALGLWMLASQIECNKRPGILKAALTTACFLFAPVFSGLLWFLVSKVFRTGIDNIWDLWRLSW